MIFVPSFNTTGNGEEYCLGYQCFAGDDPCPAADTICDPGLASCVLFECDDNGDCDDGDYCNGVETCNTNNYMCVDGTPPCTAPQTCNEGNDACENDGGGPTDTTEDEGEDEDASGAVSDDGGNIFTGDGLSPGTKTALGVGGALFLLGIFAFLAGLGQSSGSRPPMAMAGAGGPNAYGKGNQMGGPPPYGRDSGYSKSTAVTESSGGWSAATSVSGGTYSDASSSQYSKKTMSGVSSVAMTYASSESYPDWGESEFGGDSGNTGTSSSKGGRRSSKSSKTSKSSKSSKSKSRKRGSISSKNSASKGRPKSASMSSTGSRSKGSRGRSRSKSHNNHSSSSGGGKGLTWSQVS